MNYESVSLAFEPVEGASNVSSLDDLFQHIARWLYDVVAERLVHSVEQDILSCWLAEDIFAPDDEWYSGVKEGGMWFGFTRDGAGVGAHWFSVAAAMHRHELAARFEACGYRLTTDFPAPQGQVVFDPQYNLGPYAMSIIEDGQHIVEFSLKDPLGDVLDFGRGLDIKLQDLSASDRARIEWLHQNKQCGCSLCTQHNVLSDIWPMPPSVEPLMRRANDIVSALADVQDVYRTSVIMPKKEVADGAVLVGTLEHSSGQCWQGVTYHPDGQRILAYTSSLCAVWCVDSLSQSAKVDFDERVIGVQWFNTHDVIVATSTQVWRWSLSSGEVVRLFVYVPSDEHASHLRIYGERLAVLSDDYGHGGVWLHDLVQNWSVARFQPEDSEVLAWRWVSASVDTQGLLIGGYGSAHFELSLAASMDFCAETPMDCYHVAWSSRGDLAVAMDQEVIVWLSQDEKAVRLWTSFVVDVEAISLVEDNEEIPWIENICWSRDGRFLLICGVGDNIRLTSKTLWEVSQSSISMIAVRANLASEASIVTDVHPKGTGIVFGDTEGLGVWSVVRGNAVV